MRIKKNVNNEAASYITTRPFPFRYLNGLENFLQNRKKSFVNLSDESLIKSAAKITKLTDFGSDDFLEPFRILIKSCNEDAGLDLFGRFVLKNLILRILINRLCIQDELKRHPEILQEQIQRPLFIVSLPRTGTTLLHNLLSLDNKVRYLHHWEAAAPSLHLKFVKKNKDPRLANARRTLKLIKKVAPILSTAHLVTAEGPEECQYLLGHSFANTESFVGLADLEQFTDWTEKNDTTPVYYYYRNILKLLQSHQSGSHWVLKSPDHLHKLKNLIDVFPDANVILTHRNLHQVIPSCCSLVAMGRGAHSNTVDLEKIGQTVMDWMESSLKNALEVYAVSDSGQFYNVWYDDLMKNPATTLQKVNDYFGYDCDDALGEKIDQWLHDNRQHKDGVHRYSLEQFGLNPLDIDKKFSFYTERFSKY